MGKATDLTDHQLGGSVLTGSLSLDPTALLGTTPWALSAPPKPFFCGVYRFQIEWISHIPLICWGVGAGGLCTKVGAQQELSAVCGMNQKQNYSSPCGFHVQQGSAEWGRHFPEGPVLFLLGIIFFSPWETNFGFCS